MGLTIPGLIRGAEGVVSGAAKDVASAVKPVAVHPAVLNSLVTLAQHGANALDQVAAKGEAAGSADLAALNATKDTLEKGLNSVQFLSPPDSVPKDPTGVGKRIIMTTPSGPPKSTVSPAALKPTQYAQYTPSKAILAQAQAIMSAQAAKAPKSDSEIASGLVDRLGMNQPMGDNRDNQEPSPYTYAPESP